MAPTSPESSLRSRPDRTPGTGRAALKSASPAGDSARDGEHEKPTELTVGSIALRTRTADGRPSELLPGRSEDGPADSLEADAKLLSIGELGMDTPDSPEGEDRREASEARTGTGTALPREEDPPSNEGLPVALPA